MDNLSDHNNQAQGSGFQKSFPQDFQGKTFVFRKGQICFQNTNQQKQQNKNFQASSTDVNRVPYPFTAKKKLAKNFKRRSAERC